MQELQETGVRSLDWEDPLEEGMAAHSSLLACRIPWTEEPGGLQSIGFSKQEYQNVLPFPSPGDLSKARIEPVSLVLAHRFSTTESPGEPFKHTRMYAQ